MPHETTNVVMAYLCACGKKWSITRKPAGRDANTSFRGECGRTIVVYDGVVYGSEKKSKAERR